MKKSLLAISVVALSLTTKSQTLVFSDDFDTYTVDQGVAAQSTEWTTWDGASTWDAMVSSDFAFSGANSAKIDGTSTDFVKPIGPYTSGKYDIKFKMYLTDAGGYFNLMHVWDANSTNYEWACDFFFATDGTATWTVEGAAGGDYACPIGEWFDVQVTADLDNDMGYYYIQGTQVTSWQWSINNGSGAAGTNQLIAADFYGTNDAQGEGLYYMDDFQVLESTDVNVSELNPLAISIYPNPAQDQITVNSTSNGMMEIVDLQGKVVMTANLNHVVSTWNIASLSNGIYTLRVINTQGVSTAKLVVE